MYTAVPIHCRDGYDVQFIHQSKVHNYGRQYKGELDPKVVVAKNATTTRHGAIAGKTQIHKKLIYNLDVIISVGYRVKSKRGTQFRIWATSILKEYLIKGYAVRSDPVSLVYAEQRDSISSRRHQARCRRCFGSSNPDDC